MLPFLACMHVRHLLFNIHVSSYHFSKRFFFLIGVYNFIVLTCMSTFMATMVLIHKYGNCKLHLEAFLVQLSMAA